MTHATDTIVAAGLTITASHTTPTRPGKQPRDVWNVTGNLEPWRSLLYDLGGRRWRSAISFWTDPTEALCRALATTAPDTYADRRAARQARAEARTARYEGYRDNAEARAELAFRAAHAAVDGIPFGQPILVGHHSERRHRRALERSDNAMRRGMDATETAEYYAHRAAAAEHTAADRHDAGFCQRRIREAETEIRRLERQRASFSSERLSHLIRTQTEKRNHWRAELDALGGIALTRETIAAGDHVLTRHGWATATRVNPLTVSVRWDSGPLAEMTAKYPYAELTGHHTREAIEDAGLFAEI